MISFRRILIFMFFFCFLQCYGQFRFIPIPDGIYTIGSLGSIDNPRRQVTIEGLQISDTEVTNADFERFITETGYITLAEKYNNGQVFEPGLEEFRWLQDSTAYWRFPNGISRGGIIGKMNHPVTGISYRDVIAFCEWANVRLPTFEEWEVAAKAGSDGAYSKGVSLGNIKEYANIWHGRNHLLADTTDGYVTTSPVKSFKPNAWGLYDVFGNVFEFCDGRLGKDGDRRVAHARGGSWWCSQTSCAAFNSVFIGSVHPNASFSNLGFRVVKKIAIE